MLALTHPLVAATTLPVTAPVNYGLGRLLHGDWLTNKLLQNATMGAPSVAPPAVGAGLGAALGSQQQQPDLMSLLH